MLLHEYANVCCGMGREKWNRFGNVALVDARRKARRFSHERRSGPDVMGATALVVMLKHELGGCPEVQGGRDGRLA